jgi:SpoVK/Ycf46/Vps4 family AAA+-type ATPase
MRQANEIYKAGNAHVIILHGNVNDYQDNQGRLANLRQLLMAATDDNYTKELMEKRGVVVQTQDNSTRGTEKAENKEKATRICAIYVANEGLKFDSDKSKQLFVELMTKEYANELKANKFPPDFLSPFKFESVMFTISKLFEASKSIRQYNRRALREGTTLKPEAATTIIFSDCDGFFPAGSIASLNGDRMPIIYMRNWAKDKEIGNSNRIFLVTRHLSDIHESLRGGVSGISTILVPKPNLEDREAFSKNFCENLQKRCNAMKLAGDPLVIDGKEVTGVQLAHEFDHRGVGIQSAGMSRIQIEQAYNTAINKGVVVDDRLVREVKQKCLEEEYDGLIEFEHPEFGFDRVGGHAEIKEYCTRKIRNPLRSGDSRTASSGVIFTGPAGTGKTWLAKAIAYESGVNFLNIHLSKLMNRYVGGTEEKTDKLIEAIWAAAPCVAFFDEIESALGGGRVTQGDSNTGGRIFNSLMTFFSDDSRKGKIVILAATNRPELLDAALIRDGRFDALLPILPPPSSGQAAIDGRSSILQALVRKHGVKFDDSVAKTMNDALNGLGRLLRDEEHIWTGAEIESLLKDAIENALWTNEPAITVEHWNDAMDNYMPMTQDVDRMTNWALYYANKFKFVPAEWKEKARDKVALMHILKGGEDYRAA